MNRKLAFKILDIPESSNLEDIKKKYKLLMMTTHPDMMCDYDYPYNASEINVAYDFLEKNFYSFQTEKTVSDRNVDLWNAPINESAYCERDIYGYAENLSGNIEGNIQLASGKYVWIEDEDFSLFLLSLFNCSKKIVDNVENNQNVQFLDVHRRQLQGEIAYLLAGQFVDPLMVLRDYKEGNIYRISAMLEYTGNCFCRLNEGVYPKGIKKHRLFVVNEEREELGYISFKDDRLYYCLFPLFEAGNVMIKMRATSEGPKGVKGKKYSDLSLEIIFKEKASELMMESINSRIERTIKIAVDRFNK